MIFPGAFVSKTEDGVHVLFTVFDDTDLSESSQWTEALQNEDPTMPAGFVHPGMIIAETARRFLEGRPELKPAVEAFMASGNSQADSAGSGAVCTVRSVEEFGLLCLGLAARLEESTRVRPASSSTPPGDAVDGEIPF